MRTHTLSREGQPTLILCFVEAGEELVQVPYKDWNKLVTVLGGKVVVEKPKKKRGRPKGSGWTKPNPAKKTNRRCPVCRESFWGDYAMLLKHQIEKGCMSAHRCGECGLYTPNEHGLNMHRSRMHPTKTEEAATTPVEPSASSPGGYL